MWFRRVAGDCWWWGWFDLEVAAPEEMSREELIALVGEQAARIAELDARIAELTAANAESAARLARLEHLLSRNSANSSMPPSRDDDPGKTAPVKPKRRAGSGRKRGKQPGAPGTHLAWTDDPTERVDRFPQGRCGCGAELAAATDLGIVDRYQQHEIPAIAVRVTQYDQHRVLCGCGVVHTAPRPEGARSGPVGYGPNLQAFAVYLMVVQFIPAHRVVALLESLTGAAPSVGFVHGMLARAVRVAGRGGQTHPRPDHPGLRGVLRRDPAAGRAQATEAGPEEGREVPAGRLHRALHQLPGRRPRPGHVQGVP